MHVILCQICMVARHVSNLESFALFKRPYIAVGGMHWNGFFQLCVYTL